MICYLSRSYDPAFNLALEEVVLKQECDDDIIILWQNDNAIIIGRNQNTHEEINQEQVDQNHVKVVRRNTGGGAVYQDLGNQNFSFIQNKNKPSSYQVMLQPVIRTLQKLGVPAKFSGKNDILIAGRKVSGNAQYVYHNRLLHHGTLLFDVDLTKIIRYLNPNVVKIKSKGIKSRRAQVTNIKAELPDQHHTLTLAAFRQRLLDEFVADDVEIKPISTALHQAALKCAREKYRTWDWNYGAFPHFELKNKVYFPEKGTVEVVAQVDMGKIKDVKFFGDFNGGPVPVADLEENLRGVLFQQEALAQVLKTDVVAQVFDPRMTSAEIIRLMLNLKRIEQ